MAAGLTSCHGRPRWAPGSLLSRFSERGLVRPQRPDPPWAQGVSEGPLPAESLTVEAPHKNAMWLFGIVSTAAWKQQSERGGPGAGEGQGFRRQPSSRPHRRLCCRAVAPTPVGDTRPMRNTRMGAGVRRTGRGGEASCKAARAPGKWVTSDPTSSDRRGYWLHPGQARP